MEDIALLGNAAAVPVIMAATQLLKKNFSFKYKSDVVTFGVAMIVTPGWWFYHTPEADIALALGGGGISVVKFALEQLMISIATWMTASKSYDLTTGNKKRAELQASEKQELEIKITELENGHTGDTRNENNENPPIVDRLREILEGHG